MTARRSARTPTTPTLYFAYGSNMNSAQMAQRCPDAHIVGWGFLPKHALVFAGHSQRWGAATADIRPKLGTRVLGILYSISKSDLAALDRAEGYPYVYDRKNVVVHAEGGLGNVKALTYFMSERRPLGAPASAYVEPIRAVYRALGVPFPR